MTTIKAQARNLTLDQRDNKHPYISAFCHLFIQTMHNK